MIASQVHAVIAAGLENPALLSLWRREPERLRDCGVDPDTLDLGALWKFAGLTAKVRHNGLRADLPLTFRLLNVAGLEIDVFASYASFQASHSRQYAGTSDARSRDLLSFLEHWLDFHRREHALLWDMIRHELALKQLARLDNGAPVLPSEELARRFARDNSAPRVCGDVVLHEMRSDAQLVGRMLGEKSPRLDDISLGNFHVCYWRKSGTAAEICILQLDELGFYLLSLADGVRSISDLSCLMGGRHRPAKGFLNALDNFAAIGILGFDKGLEKGR